MNRYAVACIVAAVFAVQGSAEEKSPSGRFENEIKAFEAADAKSPPPQNAVLFAGASGIRMWKSLAQDFPNHTTINRGFGGSQIADNTSFAERIVFPYKPQAIVFQAGGNDINAGKSPEQVCQDFQAYVEKVRSRLPDVKIVYFSIQPSPARWSQFDKQRKANRLIEKYIEGKANLVYVNASEAFLTSDEKPREELFIADKLHHNDEGYKVRTSILKPVLDTLVPPQEKR